MPTTPAPDSLPAWAVLPLARAVALFPAAEAQVTVRPDGAVIVRFSEAGEEVSVLLLMPPLERGE